jgi:hypothetical protein
VAEFDAAQVGVVKPQVRITIAEYLGDTDPRVTSQGVASLLRSDVVGTSSLPANLAEHRVLFGVGHDLPYLLRTAARDGDLGGPRQRLLA